MKNPKEQIWIIGIIGLIILVGLSIGYITPGSKYWFIVPITIVLGFFGVTKMP